MGAQSSDAATHRTLILTAVITAAATIIAAVIGLLATGRTITADSSSDKPGETKSPLAAATKTIPGPTVTVTVSAEETTRPSDAVHLADQSSVPEGALVDAQVNHETDLGIDGKSFDFGWSIPGSKFSNAQVVMGINANQGYSKLQARLGLADTSSNSSGKLTILRDGSVFKTYEVDLPSSHDVTVPISGIQRVEIKMLAATGDVTYAVGDPVLVP